MRIYNSILNLSSSLDKRWIYCKKATMFSPDSSGDSSFKLLGVFSICAAICKVFKIRKVFYSEDEFSLSMRPKIEVFMFPPRA